MYGLPRSFDGNLFVGRTLEQICFSENQISLHFDGGVGLTIEGAYSYQNTATVQAPTLHAALAKSLGQSIARANGDSDGTLSLLFDSGDQLNVFDDPHYESYQIRHGTDVIIV
jgi:hypothetical protein